MPSRTALVLANRGDPIFGAIARRLAGPLIRIGRSLVGSARAAIQTVRGTVQTISGSQAIARRGTQAVTIARSRTARVIAGTALTGGTAFVAGRSGARSALEGEVVFGEGGCPTGKIVNVAAHQRVIPLDRFGRPRRRIDVLNTKALSRATRRLGGFQKKARRVEKQLARIAPRSRSRRRSKGVC